MEWLNELLVAYPWGIYVLVALGPFIQEDAAILSAAAASAAGAGTPHILFVMLIIGLSISDLWKYWLGRAGHTNVWGRKFAEKPGVAKSRENVINRLGMSLITARFVPGTRIPLYIACGFFKAPFLKVAAFVISSAIIYAGIAFTLFHKLGDVAGEQIHTYAPIVAVIIVVIVVTYLILSAKLRKRSNNAQEDVKNQ